MDFLTALEKADPVKLSGLPESGLLLFTPWESKTLEVFLKAHAAEQNTALHIQSNGFDSLWMDLEALASEGSSKNPTPLMLMIDDELILPGAGLRSDAVLDRQRIEQHAADAGKSIDRFCAVVSRLAEYRTMLLLHTGLPDYPLFSAPQGAESSLAVHHHRFLAALSQAAASQPDRITVIDPDQVWRGLSPRQVIDDRLLFTGGWPLSPDATDQLAQAIAGLLLKKTERRKLLITDADQTLWKGLVGEDGVHSVSWAQEPESYRHLIYQKTLNLLMSEGILVAIASKNTPEVLGAVLSRDDLALNRGELVSEHASWAPKSEVIGAILSETNLLAGSVVFVDDSEFELGEVAAAWPEIQCLQFPSNNAGLREFLEKLRSSFDTRVVTLEDGARSRNVRQSAQFQREAAKADSLNTYLSGLEMRASFEPIHPDNSERSLQLINKTNQFNLSGRQFDAAEWQALLHAGKGSSAWQVRFKDRNSDYGVVSVICVNPERVVTDWVLSCRVFGRTIEHCTMNFVQEKLANGPIRLEGRDTGKNHAVRTFLSEVASELPDNTWSLKTEAPLQTFVLPS